MKKVLWIDDWPGAMKGMLSGFFHRLWANHIRSEIALFGNAYVAEKNYQNNRYHEEMEKLIQATYSEFVAFLLCQNVTVENLSDYSQLICERESKIFQQDPSSDIVKDRQEVFDTIWSEYDNMNLSVEQYDSIGEKIYNELALKDYQFVLVDLRLSSYDNVFYNKVFDLPVSGIFNENKPLLSMILYHYITSNDSLEQKVMVYSTYTRPTDLVHAWIEMYKRIFNEDSSIDIYNRYGESVLNQDSDNLEKIITNE